MLASVAEFVLKKIALGPHVVGNSHSTRPRLEGDHVWQLQGSCVRSSTASGG